MQIKGIRIYIVIAAITVTLAILLTIQFVYRKYNVEQPLFKLYSQTKLVKGAKLEEHGNTFTVVLDVNKTDNLRQAYRDLTEYTEQIMGNKNFTIQLKDNRSKALENAYYQSQFIIYEALAQGDFTKMADVIQQNASKVGAVARVFIDDDNIYVQFLQGKNYLYEITPRQHEVSGNIADVMGSGQK